MVKIKCLTLSQESNSYKGPSGNLYRFQKEIFTEVEAKDAEYFLTSGGGKFFVSDTLMSKIQEGINKAKDAIKPKTIESDKIDITKADGKVSPIDDQRRADKPKKPKLMR